LPRPRITHRPSGYNVSIPPRPLCLTPGRLLVLVPIDQDLRI
jgi:hypothetical protein